ncbi:MAG TPA: sugar ABC transporter ATP-binding protein [Atribacteraceae bacterium]|nr:sugar ABC transporter ATP-binding protein [Atribacteraceae bacterium]
MAHDGNILTTVALCKNYPGVRALDSVDFDLRYGEVHALVGQNGAGKSTLIEIIAGSIRPDSGAIVYEGSTYSSFDPWQSIDLGIQTVHQENLLVEELSVAENMFLYDLPTRKGGFVQYGECISCTQQLLQSLGMKIPPEKRVAQLSFVEQKLVSIARAFSRSLKLLILDEPTASLDEQGKNILFQVIERHKAKGLSIIYISHNLYEIFEVCDRVTVLKDGKKVATQLVKEVTMRDVVRNMIGSSQTSLYKRDKSSAPVKGIEVLRVENYCRQERVRNVSFQVRKGEIFGLAGLVGSGRTELARLLFGIDQKDAGRLFFHEKEITLQNPSDAIRKGIGYLTEDRKGDGLLLSRPIVENVSLVSLAKVHQFLLTLPWERREVDALSKQMNIKTPSIDQLVVNLSGGNQQKVVIAKWLLADSEVLIIDEPTVGVDVGAKVEIYRMIEQLAGQGKSIVMISSDNPELMAVCDRVGVMRNGELIVILEGDEMTEENILHYAMGVYEEMEVPG